MEYDNEVIGVILGMAYSWQDFSLTFILSDLNVANDNLTDDYTQFGSLTFAWRHK